MKNSSEPAPSPAGTATRLEQDSFGLIAVPAHAWWGAQTQRSLRYFAIGAQRMPRALIHAMAHIKGAAAEVNLELGCLASHKAAAIAHAAARVADGQFDDQFPLSMWQTGSGTQSHMNVNEVIANLASTTLLDSVDLAGQEPADGNQDATPHTLATGHGAGVDAHDDVNLGQSTNDVFPTAMHIASSLQTAALLVSLGHLQAMLAQKAGDFARIVKIGRTHLQDATPLSFGQEFGGYVAQLAVARRAIEQTLPALHALAIGGTAVGTGMNTAPRFGARVAAVLSRRLGQDFVVADNLFAAIAGHEALVSLHGALKTLCVALLKIANDIRLMGSGPRAGLGELRLPANEPGSSMMPGKVNPTQIEALCMVCAQVMGHDVAIGFAASQGQLELNAYKPLIAANVLDSLQLLRDAMASFGAHCVAGLEVDEAHVAALLGQSLVGVTALAPHIGYARSAAIAQHAQSHGSSLREAALAFGAISAHDFDSWTDTALMLSPRAACAP